MHPGTRIQLLLTEQGISQRSLADALHLTPSTVNGYIRGRRCPDCAKLSAIAGYLDTSIDYLLGNSDLKSSPDLSLNASETSLLNNYRSMSRKQQHVLDELAAALLLCDEHDGGPGGNP